MNKWDTFVQGPNFFFFSGSHRLYLFFATFKNFFLAPFVYVHDRISLVAIESKITIF